MRRWKLLVVPLLSLLCAQAFAGCYTVYGAANRVLYQAERPPVDMSLPLHDTVPARFPGGFLVFDSDMECPVVSSVAIGNGGIEMATSSPLLTNVGGAPGAVQATGSADTQPHKTGKRGSSH